PVASSKLTRTPEPKEKPIRTPPPRGGQRSDFGLSVLVNFDLAFGLFCFWLSYIDRFLIAVCGSLWKLDLVNEKNELGTPYYRLRSKRSRFTCRQFLPMLWQDAIRRLRRNRDWY